MLHLTRLYNIIADALNTHVNGCLNAFSPGDSIQVQRDISILVLRADDYPFLHENAQGFGVAAFCRYA